MTFFGILERIGVPLALELLVVAASSTSSASVFLKCEVALQDPPGVARLKEIATRPHEQIVVRPETFDRGPTHIIHGFPQRARFLTVQGTEIFRHFTSKKIREIICTGSELVAGSAPFIETGFARKIYVDLTGIFITKPEFGPSQVGLDAAEQGAYVDFHLPAGTQILEISKEISLIPGPPQTHDWVASSYEKWKSGQLNGMDAGMLNTLMEIDRRGGVQEPLRQNIEILASSCR